eukprot:10299691-Prorocentrum_lima.AAC.1
MCIRDSNKAAPIVDGVISCCVASFLQHATAPPLDPSEGCPPEHLLLVVGGHPGCQGHSGQWDRAKGCG